MGFGDFVGGLIPGLLSGGGTPSVPKPKDYFAPGRRGQPSVAQKMITGVEDYYGSAIPSSMRLMDLYGSGYMQQGLRFGQEGLTGLTALQQQAGLGAAEQMAGLRSQELGTMAEQSPLFRFLAQSLSPEQAAMVSSSTREAERADVASRGLTPQEQRMAQQQAREAYGARGMLGSTGSVVGEALGRENILAAKRAEAADARQRAFTQAERFYTIPGLETLRAVPTSYGAGTTMAGMGLQLGQSLTPQIDYNLPLSLARERAGALDARNLAQFQVDMQAKQAQQKMFGDILGAAASMAMMASDVRLKTDIRRVGTTNGGIPIYTYKYKGDDVTRMGVMAQDVEKTNPDSVREIKGYKVVDYNLIR